MSPARITTLVLIGLGPFGATGSVGMASGQVDCIADRSRLAGRTIVADRPDGVSSDGRGSYTTGNGVRGSVVGIAAALALTSRKLTINLDHPVPGAGGVRLGIITDDHDNRLSTQGFDQPTGIYTQWKHIGDSVRSLLSIPVGHTVVAAQMNIFLHINGRFHVLQMGPQPFGHCHADWQPNLVNGTGTSSGTISRPSHARWVMDLPAGSMGRLFDVSEDPRHAVDQGLYYVQLHYEIVDAVPFVSTMLQTVAQSEGAAGIVARYRVIKRDSSSAYFFGDSELNAVGYWLLDHQRANDAMIVFRLNVDEYPGAWNARDGLGEAYLAIGDTTRAIANYKRSLELNPRNQNATDVLRRIGAKP